MLYNQKNVIITIYGINSIQLILILLNIRHYLFEINYVLEVYIVPAKNGLFNVPFGNYKPTPEIIIKKKIDKIYELIKDVEFIYSDFNDSIPKVMIRILHI